ncbi:MAG: hypothetical protein KatS3mg072_1671 [Meiothermus sp.]|nr:MAG: hypothetical protein KatS3mg072_1671 [Meiothermus sp.]
MVSWFLSLLFRMEQSEVRNPMRQRPLVLYRIQKDNHQEIEL